MTCYHPDYPKDLPDDVTVDPEDLAREYGADPEWGRLGKIANLRALDFLGKIKGLVAMGPSLKLRDDEPCGDKKYITFFVKKMLPLSKIPKGQILPKKLDGCPTQVVELGEEAKPLQCDNNPRTFHDVIQAGLSVGPQGDNSFGTITVVGENIGSGTDVFWTCHHVALPSSNVTQSSNGEVMVHPAEGHAVGGDQLRIGSISHSLPLLPFPLPNFVDFAKGRCHPQMIQTNRFNPPNPRCRVRRVLCRGQSRGVTYPAWGLDVYKIGARTGRTVGRVISPHLPTVIIYDGLPVLLLDQVLLDIRQREGDSGAGVFSRAGDRFVGMIMGHAGHFAFATPFWWIFALGGVRL